MPRLSTTKDVIRHCLPYIKGRVLDLGAGTAKYKSILMKRASEYIACDIKKTKDVDVICDVENLIFSPESFDTVVSTQLLEHVNNPYRVIKEIKKVLKIGGNAVITVPFMVPYHPDPYDNFRFSKEGLEKIFKFENFEIIDSGIYGGFFMVVSEIVHFSFFNPYKKKNNFFMGFIEKIAKFLDKIFSSKSTYANAFIVVKKI